MFAAPYPRTCSTILFVLALGMHGSYPASSACAQASPAKDDTEAKQRDQEIQRLVGIVKDKGFYGLKDPTPKKAVEALRKYGEHAAPALAAMLAEGHKNRKQGWIEVFRPLHILRGMGPAAKVALPDIIRALDDAHSINVGEAADLLAEIGPAAKEAVPALLRAWEKAKGNPRAAQESLAKALQKLDPKAAAKAGIP